MAIDKDKIVGDLSQLKIQSDTTGLIPAFGVLIQQLPADFWNSFSQKILDAAGDDLFESAEGLLENAAAECGYNTGHGIISSEEFKAVVEPMVEETPADIIRGAYAVFSAWGWADSEVVELIPGEKMVVRTYDYYEADIKNPKKPFAYMIKGVSRAFMDLAYGEPYPNGHGAFKCEQTKGIEIGDEYGEFVVTRV